jgi:hypothetical protein
MTITPLLWRMGIELVDRLAVLVVVIHRFRSICFADSRSLRSHNYVPHEGIYLPGYF